MPKKLTVIFLIFLTVTLKAQTDVTLFPDKLNIQPFTANTLEPKLGCQFDLNNNELALNISNSLDIINVAYSNNSNLSVGADLFTFTLLRSETAFHFPVDAVDYLFGLNLGYKKNRSNGDYGFRLRLSHISAHFADGHYDGAVIKGWRDGLNPRVYSREFFELMPFYSINGLRIYGGLTYLFHVDPPDVGKIICQAGFDYFIKGFLNKNINPFVGYDLKLIEINKYRGNNSIYGGFKFGSAEGKGLSLYYAYYNGFNFHGEYFNFDNQYSALGFNLDL